TPMPSLTFGAPSAMTPTANATLSLWRWRASTMKLPVAIVSGTVNATLPNAPLLSIWTKVMPWPWSVSVLLNKRSTAAPASKPLPEMPTLDPCRTVPGFSSTSGLRAAAFVFPCATWTVTGVTVGELEATVPAGRPAAVPVAAVAAADTGVAPRWPAVAPVVSTATSSAPRPCCSAARATATATRMPITANAIRAFISVVSRPGCAVGVRLLAHPVHLELDVAALDGPDLVGVGQRGEDPVLALVGVVLLHGEQHLVGHHEVVDVPPVLAEQLVADVWVGRCLPVGVRPPVVGADVVQVGPEVVVHHDLRVGRHVLPDPGELHRLN